MVDIKRIFPEDPIAVLQLENRITIVPIKVESHMIMGSNEDYLFVGELCRAKPAKKVSFEPDQVVKFAPLSRPIHRRLKADDIITPFEKGVTNFND